LGSFVRLDDVARLDLAELVNAKVRDEIARANGRLEQLIREAVDRELQTLVHGLVEQNLDGRFPIGSVENPTRASSVRLCSVCGERPAAKHRTKCERCRHTRNRERRDDAEDPRTDPAAA
jgi:hypothetical protein